MSWKRHLLEKFKKTCSELKSYYDNKQEPMKLEIGNLQTQIEHLKKENIDLKSKAKITSSIKLGSHRAINPDSISKLVINQKLSPKWR